MSNAAPPAKPELADQRVARGIMQGSPAKTCPLVPLGSKPGREGAQPVIVGERARRRKRPRSPLPYCPSWGRTRTLLIQSPPAWAGISDNLLGYGRFPSIGARFPAVVCPLMPGETTAKLRRSWLTYPTVTAPSAISQEFEGFKKLKPAAGSPSE
jgi:hypothetical protein